MAGLLMTLSASLALAQPSPTGTLAGKLTDLHSKPLDGATLVLRNAATGAEVKTTSSKQGGYRFESLAPGRYTLEAESPRLGRGHLEDIFVAAGHESRVQAALALDGQRPEPLIAAARVQIFVDPPPHPVDPAPQVAAGPSLPGQNSEKPTTVAVTLQAKLSFEPVETLHLSANRAPEPSSTLARPLAPAAKNPDANRATSKSSSAPGMPPAPAISHPDSLVPAQATIQESLLPQPVAAVEALNVNPAASRPVTPVIAAVAQRPPGLPKRDFPVSGPADSGSLNLTGQELEALPLRSRNWEDFVLDSAVASAGNREDEQQRTTGMQGNSGPVTVDGASTRLAFGGRAGARMRGLALMGPGSNQAAIGEVHAGGDRLQVAEDSAAGPVRLQTHGGSTEPHGQGFVFDRQNLFGAQNPFTQWVRETSPATGAAVPVFSALPYTAPEREIRWGLGVGGRVSERKLFWFAAYDGLARNDPGVATVKHPDDFFAQPANDEMQVLSARLGLSSTDPVSEGVAAYSGMLETLSGLLGPAARTASQRVGFGRLDWNAAERHSFSLEGTGADWNSPGGGITRAAEPYGTHSFGSSRASEWWLLGRWEAFLTPNLLAVTQGSAGRHILTEGADPPSPFEQTLNVNAWGQLPQMVVDSRYGFTIGNPARFGTGAYPDEHLYQLQEGLDWVRGAWLVKAGVDWRHNSDATSMVRNHTGTYHYATVEDFASDALVFARYGLAGALDPMNQHNCDQRGRAWRDADHQLHGLGYLPCYSSYSQTMGPTDWHLSTNDLAGFATAQWQPARRFVFSAALRWQREFLPPPIPLVDNPDLPLTRRLPSLGDEWAPRVGVAWGSRERHWPTLRLGYGMYFGRTQNSLVETALTQTGSLKGDLNFFMRPTDNLATGGAPPFPYVLAGEPTTVVKPGAVEFAPAFRNAEIHQGEASLQQELPGHVQVTASAAVSLGRRLPVTVDSNIDPAVNPGVITYAVFDSLGAGPIKSPQITVPFFASWPAAGSATGTSGRLNANYQQILELMSRANSTYEAAMLRVSRQGRKGLGFILRYHYAHAMDWNPDESTQVFGSGILDPTDFSQEYGTSDLDIRHSASSMVIWQAPWKLKNAAGRIADGWMLSGIGQFRSGLPFTMRTAGFIPEEFETTGAAIVGLGPGMNGSGGDNRVYGVGRNTYRYPFTWKADLRMGKKFNLGQMRELELLAESFNLFNHQNVTRLETTGYSISSGSAAGSLPTLNFLTGLKTGQTEFGKPLDVNAVDFYRPRQFDFGMKMRF